MAVLMNEAMAHGPDLAGTVIRETGTMRRQVDHHLARARALGRRAAGQARADVWPSLQAVERAVSRMHPHATVDIDEIGRASCRERVCQYVDTSVVARALKKKTHDNT